MIAEASISAAHCTGKILTLQWVTVWPDWDKNIGTAAELGSGRSARSTYMHNINIPAGLSAAHTILILNSLDREMQPIACNNIISL
jgi:hypothetical protein